METNKRCVICGYSDKQDDMRKNESGEWMHAECEADALRSEQFNHMLNVMDEDDNSADRTSEDYRAEQIDNHNAPSEGYER